MKTLITAVALVALTTTAVDAQVQVTELVIAANVVDREPQGADSTFMANVGQLYAFTRLTGGTPGTTISHVWKRGEEEMARVELNANGSPWRTWSRKNIVPEWTGTWTVEVVASDGSVLRSVQFTIR